MGLGAQRAKPVGWVSFSPSPDYARCPETHTEAQLVKNPPAMQETLA